MQIIDFILHCNNYIGDFINLYGNMVYLIIFGIIFCETGLVFLPFFPGDSLIFAAGSFAGMGMLNFWILLIGLIVAAIVGDAVNYLIGKKFGEKILKSKLLKVIKQENVDKAEHFIEKHGGIAVFLARFMPIIRTIVPFLVGMGKLEYRKFLKYNASGAIIWVSLFLSIGYFFGNIPFVKDHFSLIIIAIIAISLVPMIIPVIKRKLRKMQPIKRLKSGEDEI